MRRVMLLAVAAIAIFAIASAALAATKTPTRVTIDSALRSPTEDSWTGDIFSERRVCKDDRRVVVFRQRTGADQKIGSTRSYKGSDQPGYFWIYAQEERAPSGKYYAKAPATDQCEADRSPTIQSSW